MSSPSLDLYRILVPGHAAVPGDTVEAWLTLAGRRLDPAAFGQVYAEAAIFWTAHFVEKVAGQSGLGGSGVAVGALTGQKDGDLSRSYAAPPSSSATDASDAALSTTEYGRLYLDLRDSRAAAAPSVVILCP